MPWRNRRLRGSTQRTGTAAGVAETRFRFPFLTDHQHWIYKNLFYFFLEHKNNLISRYNSVGSIFRIYRVTVHHPSGFAGARGATRRANLQRFHSPFRLPPTRGRAGEGTAPVGGFNQQVSNLQLLPRPCGVGIGVRAHIRVSLRSTPGEWLRPFGINLQRRSANLQLLVQPATFPLLLSGSLPLVGRAGGGGAAPGDGSTCNSSSQPATFPPRQPATTPMGGLNLQLLAQPATFPWRLRQPATPVVAARPVI